MKYVIEHLDLEVYPWSLLEYKHLSKTVGKENVIFTNVSLKDKKLLETYGEVQIKSVTQMDFTKACVLDPKAKQVLETADKDRFDYVIFGGVLGNSPMDGRTHKEISSKLPNAQVRNLGDMQMSTDTAVIVTKRILDGQKFSDLRFADELEIELEESHSQILPYRYLIEDEKVVLPDGFIEFLQHEEEFL